jgi:2-polyprenyl-6-methoxyphenol hydroxylase-like FAD-dependent oxidoreductase
MMKVVIAGGGMVGMTFARLLRLRGFEPVVIERMPAGHYVPRGYMLGFQGYEPLEEVGVYDEVRRAGRPIAPRPDMPPVAVAVRFGALIEALERDLPIVNEHTVVELLREPDGRVVGVVAEGPDGRTTFEADLVVACDGMRSPTREMAGLEADFDTLPEAALGFMSPTVADTSFAMAYQSDGGHIGMLSWNEGSSGWRSMDRVGAEAALAPGVEAIKEMWVRLLPESASAVEGVASIEQIRYSEPQLLACPRWWTPGVVIIGDAAHFFGPETGVCSGIGLGDAHALAEAIAQNPDDPDAACASYEMWRAPAVRPYEANDPGRQRIMVAGQVHARPEERWPPPAE